MTIDFDKWLAATEEMFEDDDGGGTHAIRTYFVRGALEEARAEGRREAFEEVKALNVIALLREQVERRSQALQNPNPGGQHVPDHSDFSHAQPSTITRLQWYLRAFDAEVESLASKGGGK